MNKNCTTFKGFFLFIAVLFLFSGCATVGKESYLQANTPAEQNLMDTATEVKFGHFMDAYIQNEYMILHNPTLEGKLSAIFSEIVANCDRKDLDFKLRILNSNEVNAFAGPGGYVYVTTGLLNVIKSKDEFAAVVAHEIGHICARHIVKRFYAVETAKGALTIISVLASTGSNSTVTANAISELAGLVAIISLQGYSRQDELQADSLAVKYARRSNYNTLALIDLLQRMEEQKEKETGQKSVYTILSSHPPVKDRAENITIQLNFLNSAGRYN